MGRDDEPKKCVDEITEPVDTIILGRKMAGSFISHWSNVINNPPTLLLAR
jgi:hypothetical protein